MDSIDTFGSPILADVSFNDDGSLKQSGKQNIKFYNRKRLNFRAKKDENGNLIMDKKTGLPAKEAYEEIVEMVRVETKGDTNIKDDIANDLDRRQHYRHYKHFREGKIPEGNPIEDFDFLQPSTIMELHMYGIHVLQQVAIMSDLECEQIKDQSGFEIRDIAAQWVRINSPQGQAGKATKLELENVRLRRQLEDARAAKNTRFVAPKEPEAVVEEAPIATLELTPEEMAKPRRQRKV